MAKRHHHMKGHHSKRMGAAHMVYKGEKEAERMMHHDAGMINDDMSAPALLPRHVIEKYWAEPAYSSMGMVDDLYSGVQRQMKEDSEDMRKIYSPKKY